MYLLSTQNRSKPNCDAHTGFQRMGISLILNKYTYKYLLNTYTLVTYQSHNIQDILVSINYIVKITFTCSLFTFLSVYF